MRTLLVLIVVGAGLAAAAPAASAASVCVDGAVGDCGWGVACADWKNGRGWDLCVGEYYCPMVQDGRCAPPFDP